MPPAPVTQAPAKSVFVDPARGSVAPASKSVPTKSTVTAAPSAVSTPAFEAKIRTASPPALMGPPPSLTPAQTAAPSGPSDSSQSPAPGLIGPVGYDMVK
jgi:hypothetical protein